MTTKIIVTIFMMGLFVPILPARSNPTTNPTQIKPVTVNLTGTIHKLVLAGTCYQLATDNGKKYELMGKFPKIDGTRVRVRGVLDPDIATICQVGQPVRVTTVTVIK